MTIERRCPLCGAAGGAAAFPHCTRWDGIEFRYLRCVSCAAVFVTPVPTSAQVEAIYSWADYHETTYAEVDQTRYEAAVDFLADHVSAGATVLDFGCGRGGFLEAAGRRGFACEGVEVSSEVCSAVGARTGMRVGTLDTVLGAARRFDVVVLRDVLPHVDDPAAVMRELEEALVDGGVFFFDGPLEEQPNLVRAIAVSSRRLRSAVASTPCGSFAPTMLYRTNASAQRRFLCQRLGYREQAFRTYDTGWPYYAPGGRHLRGGAVKHAIGRTSVALSALAGQLGMPLGNRFYGVYAP